MIFPGRGRSLPLQSSQFIESRGSRAGRGSGYPDARISFRSDAPLGEEQIVRDSDWEHELRRRFLIATALN